MKPISFKSRDGLTIHGYLTVPLNQDHSIPHPRLSPFKGEGKPDRRDRRG